MFVFSGFRIRWMCWITRQFLSTFQKSRLELTRVPESTTASERWALPSHGAKSGVLVATKPPLWRIDLLLSPSISVKSSTSSYTRPSTISGALSWWTRPPFFSWCLQFFMVLSDVHSVSLSHETYVSTVSSNQVLQSSKDSRKDSGGSSYHSSHVFL